ncbi:hypothetical protein TWF128_006527 [Orbilia oligospora]|nr:hypothetical protein TWF128_006527 [Orbilia oligospora]
MLMFLTTRLIQCHNNEEDDSAETGTSHAADTGDSSAAHSVSNESNDDNFCDLPYPRNPNFKERDEIFTKFRTVFFLGRRPGLDNYDDPDACNIDTLLPTQDVGHILITSRTLKHRLGPRSIEVSAADTNDLKAKESTQAQNKTPILLEDAENVFLGPEKETERPVGHIIDREYHENSGHLIITVDLDIGWAHGADVGAIYDVIPLGEPIQADLGIKAQITESLGNKGLQSRATIRYPLVWGTHTSASGYPHAFNTLERVKSGSGVVPQKWGLTPVVSVKISSLRQRWI